MTGSETVLPGRNGCSSLKQYHTGQTCKDQSSSAEDVDEERTDGGEDKVRCCSSNSDAELLSCSSNTDGLESGCHLEEKIRLAKEEEQ